MNNRFKVRIEDPLLRPGLSVETEVSEKYLVRCLHGLLDRVRAFNNNSVDKGEVSRVAKEFVDRMEQHKEELRWDDPTFRLLFKLIQALRDEGLDAASWWKR